MNNKRSGTTILLICREGKSRQLYQAALDLPEVSLVCVPALMEFFRSELYCPLNGILVDMPTYMRNSEDEKRMLTDLIEIFPALRLKCNESSGEIRTLPFGAACPGNTAPSTFVQKYCASFVQRKIRTSERSIKHLSALLTKVLPVVNISCARTVTESISSVGCFLISFEPWIVGERGWLSLTELQDNSPIHVEICSIRIWGGSRALPGMGVRFIALTRSQKSELIHLCGNSYMVE